MTYIEFFKLQAKNLFKDYKTQTLTIEADGFKNYSYTPQYFDVALILMDYEQKYGIDLEESLTLMKAQHLITDMLGFRSWHDLLHASDDQLELAKLRFEHQDKISLIEFEKDIKYLERDFDAYIDDEYRLYMFKDRLNIASFLDHKPMIGFDYRINPKIIRYINPSEDAEPKIKALPISSEDMKELIDLANNSFDSYAEHYNFTNINKMKELWRPESIITKLLEEEVKPKLPLTKEKVRFLIDSLLAPFIFDLKNKSNTIASNSGSLDTKTFSTNLSKNEEITSLPLKEDLRKEFIEEANRVFSAIIVNGRIFDIAGAKKRWNPEVFVDSLLGEEMLPISKEHALSLIGVYIMNLFKRY